MFNGHTFTTVDSLMFFVDTLIGLSSNCHRWSTSYNTHTEGVYSTEHRVIEQTCIIDGLELCILMMLW